MKRLVALFLSVLLTASTFGQNVVSDFAASIKGRKASFDYTFSVRGDLPITGKGKVMLQGDAFTMTGNGLEIYCDGTTRWTVDTAAEECYIEGVAGETPDYDANPALLVGAVDKAFSLKKTSSVTFKGKKVTAAYMEPKARGTNFKSVTLYFAGKALEGASITVNDGTITEIVVSNLKCTDPQAKNSFSFDTRKLSKNYIITDLR